MLEAGNVDFDGLQVEKYVTDPQNYWNDNKAVFKLDSVSFLSIWGSFVTWAVNTSLCLVTGIVSYVWLPPEIPVQWNEGMATSLVDKRFIFAYPLACVAIRFLLRPVIREGLATRGIHGEFITEYLLNYLCFIALSIEVFSILFIYGLVKNVLTVLIVDTIVLISILIVGLTKIKYRAAG